MRNPFYSVRARFSATYLFWTAALFPPALALFLGTRKQAIGLEVLAAIAVGTAIFALVTYRGRALLGWVVTAIAWLTRRGKSCARPPEAGVGFTVQPGDGVAIRWEDDVLVALIELIPRPLTPTFVLNGRAHSDDELDTSLLEKLLLTSCPDLEADVVSAGFRIGGSSSAGVTGLYGQLIGDDPAPARRRTWILLRANPSRAQRSAQRRAADVVGLARYLVASATRLADRLCENGIDAVCGRSFDEYDASSHISFTSEKWSSVKGRGNYTAAYSAPGGPDVWWSVPAKRTITRMRITPGSPPTSVVLLTTASKPKRPPGFSRASGGQRAALGGLIATSDRHQRLPIGSAGILLGQTADHRRVYLPFDCMDVNVSVADEEAFTQFALRSAAAGGIVTLPAGFTKFAELIDARIGPEPAVAWPSATTYLRPRRGVDTVVLRPNEVIMPGNRVLPVKQLVAPDEDLYQRALPRAGRVAPPPKAKTGSPVNNGSGSNDQTRVLPRKEL